MSPLLKITTIARTPNDPANQYIRHAGQSPHNRDADHDIIYSSGGANPTAFQLIRWSSPDSRTYFRFPLIIDGRFTFPAGIAGYVVVATAGDGFKLSTLPFLVTGAVHGTEIGFTTPNGFYAADQDLQCPFRADTRWHFQLYRVIDNEVNLLAQSSTFDLEFYFFLGPTAVPTETDHVRELVHLTIPTYEKIRNLRWDQIEPTLVTDIVRKLWDLGGTTLKYNTNGGPSSYYHGAVVDLGGMLRQKRKVLNCYDLAALVCAAFQSLGYRPTNNGQIEQLVHAEIWDAEPWGYIRVGTLFGWDRAPTRFCNSPFPSMSGGSWLVPQMEISRSYFERHCVTFIRRRDGQKVIDICHTLQDSSHRLLFNDGRATWDQFVELRDVGYWLFDRPTHHLADFQVTLW